MSLLILKVNKENETISNTKKSELKEEDLKKKTGYEKAFIYWN